MLDTLLLVVFSPLFTLVCIYLILLLRRHIQRKKELAPLSLVESLPKRKWTREKDVQTNPGQDSVAVTVIPDRYSHQSRRPVITECVICLDDFIEGDIVLTLPCNHEFHEMCMYPTPPNSTDDSTPWLTTQKRTCPICKRDIIDEGVGEHTSLLNNENSSSPIHDWRGETAATNV